MLVAESLSNDILGGKYQIGELLPSENLLCQYFGISRHTVRAALQTLNRLGLVNSQQGVGTQVQRTELLSHYSHSFNSAEDLLQYAAATPVRVIGSQKVEVNAAMAAQFACKPGEHWWRVHTVRMDPKGLSVVAYSEIHIPLAFGGVLPEAEKGRQPIFALIEQRYKETIVEIQQDISCISHMTAVECANLQVPRSSPGMEIVRRYLGGNGRVLEVARSVHPGEIFKYSMRVQLRHGSKS